MSRDVLVSIIIRTCGKINVLKNALYSISKQTYANIEVIIIEDGPNASEQYIHDHFGSLHYTYYAAGKRTGRTHAGNIGLSLAKGKYLNFLDEDDILLENHVEILVNALEYSNYSIAYALAKERQFKKSKLNSERLIVKREFIRYQHPFNRLLLCYMNLFPIQSVMFSRELFVQYGGFDEELDVLEDWDLWVRYALKNDFLFVPIVTSIYYTPYRGTKKRARELDLKNASDEVIRKHSGYLLTLNAKQINEDMDYILNVFNKKGIWFLLQKIRNYLLYHDR